MSIAAQITRIQNAKASIKSAIEAELGDQIPDNVLMDGYATYVASAAEVQYASGYASGQAAGGGGNLVLNGSQIELKCWENGCYSNITISGGIVSSEWDGSVAFVPALSVESSGHASNVSVVDGGSFKVYSNGVLSGATIGSGGYASCWGKGAIVHPIVSSGGTLIFGSNGSATMVESRNGANVFYRGWNDMDMEYTSVSITDDFSQSGCNVTFKSQPKVTVVYKASLIVTNADNLSGAFGEYAMYDGNGDVYKQVDGIYYLVHVTGVHDGGQKAYALRTNSSTVADYIDDLQWECYYLKSTDGFAGTWNTTWMGDKELGGSGTMTVTQASPVGMWVMDGVSHSYGDVVDTGYPMDAHSSVTISFVPVEGYATPAPFTSAVDDCRNVFHVKYDEL